MKFLINNFVLNTRYATYTKLIEMQHGENNQPKQNNKQLSKDNAKIMLLPTSQPQTKPTNLELDLFLRFPGVTHHQPYQKRRPHRPHQQHQ